MNTRNELDVLLKAQDDLLTRRQALEHGLTEGNLRAALGPRGRWQRVVAGVYATFTGELAQRHVVRAALLHAGPESMVTGTVACRAYGMTYVPSGSSVALLVPSTVRRVPIPIATVRRVRTVPRPRMVRSFPCAPPERAVLDAVRGVPRLSEVRAALTEVVQRGLTTSQRLVAEYEVGDRRGLRQAGRALDDVRAGCWSAPEADLRDLVREGMFAEEPVWNQPIPGTPDLVPDLQFRRARLAIEVDSVQWHHLGDAVERTERKHARYAAIGWRCLPLSPRRIRDSGDAVLAQIQAAVAIVP